MFTLLFEQFNSNSEFDKIQRKHQMNKEIEKGMNENELCLNSEENTAFVSIQGYIALQKNPPFSDDEFEIFISI